MKEVVIMTSKEYMEFVAKKEKENERKFNNAISWANETLPVAEFVNIFVTEKMIKSSGGRLDGVEIGFSSYSFEGIVTGADRYDWKKYHVTVHNISGYKIEDNALKVIKHCFCGDFYI